MVLYTSHFFQVFYIKYYVIIIINVYTLNSHYSTGFRNVLYFILYVLYVHLPNVIVLCNNQILEYYFVSKICIELILFAKYI